MNRVNYDKRMLEIMKEAKGMRLLLHSCCAPCSSYCLEQLAPVYRVTVYYFNPNIDSREEYEKRKAEEVRFLSETRYAYFLDCDHSPELFRKATCGFENEPEGGARCAKCFALRLRCTAEEAKARGYDFFATTLTVSPLKNADMINAIGFAIEKEVGVRYLPTDFKKRGGYVRSIELSREYGLYRQNYCGCIYSRRD